MDKIFLSEVNLSNKCFWRNFFLCSYPNAYDEEDDIGMADIEDIITEENDLEYWNRFTGWYDGVLEDSDGYLDEPAYIETAISADETLKIEFHPGDIVYYRNDEIFGSTGPDWKLNVVSFEKVKSMLEKPDGEILFWLLLPLAVVEEKDRLDAIEFIKEKLESIFAREVCKMIAGLVVSQLVGV